MEYIKYDYIIAIMRILLFLTWQDAEYISKVRKSKINWKIQSKITSKKCYFGITKNGSERFPGETATLKQTFRTVSFPEPFRMVRNSSVFWNFLQRTVPNGFIAHFLGLCFRNVLSISKCLNRKFGHKNFRNWFLKTFGLPRRRGYTCLLTLLRNIK